MSNTLDLVDRLRGIYTVPVDDGAGLLNGKDTHTGMFEVSPVSKEAANEIEHLRAELARIRHDGPRGVWKCDECDLILTSQVIDMTNGKVGSPRVQGVPACANGCGPMRPLTWKESCANQDAGYKRLNEVIDERDAEIRELLKNLAGVVQEVVRLDTLRDEGVGLVEAAAKELERLQAEVVLLRAR